MLVFLLFLYCQSIVFLVHSSLSSQLALLFLLSLSLEGDTKLPGRDDVLLTLLLLNTTCPVLANSVDPDQLVSEEAN